MNKTMELNKILQCIQDEPELPGKMPAEMQQVLQNALIKQDVDLILSCLRITVRHTKDGIADRVRKRI